MIKRVPYLFFYVIIWIAILHCTSFAKTNLVKKHAPKNSLNLSKKRLLNLSARQQILSQNIANVNTPHYKAKDLLIKNSPNTRYKKLKNFKLTTTSSKHFAGKRYLNNKLIKVKTFESKPNGNNVSIEEELPKLSQNTNDYNSTLKIYSTLNNLISMTINNK